MTSPASIRSIFWHLSDPILHTDQLQIPTGLILHRTCDAINFDLPNHRDEVAPRRKPSVMQLNWTQGWDFDSLILHVVYASKLIQCGVAGFPMCFQRLWMIIGSVRAKNLVFSAVKNPKIRHGATLDSQLGTSKWGHRHIDPKTCPVCTWRWSVSNMSRFQHQKVDLIEKGLFLVKFATRRVGV